MFRVLVEYCVFRIFYIIIFGTRQHVLDSGPVSVCTAKFPSVSAFVRRTGIREKEKSNEQHPEHNLKVTYAIEHVKATILIPGRSQPVESLEEEFFLHSRNPEVFLVFLSH